MAYCPPELLDDVADVLDDVRGWPVVVRGRSRPRRAASSCALRSRYREKTATSGSGH